MRYYYVYQDIICDTSDEVLSIAYERGLDMDDVKYSMRELNENEIEYYREEWC